LKKNSINIMTSSEALVQQKSEWPDNPPCSPQWIKTYFLCHMKRFLFQTNCWLCAFCFDCIRSSTKILTRVDARFLTVAFACPYSRVPRLHSFHIVACVDCFNFLNTSGIDGNIRVVRFLTPDHTLKYHDNPEYQCKLIETYLSRTKCINLALKCQNPECGAYQTACSGRFLHCAECYKAIAKYVFYCSKACGYAHWEAGHEDECFYVPTRIPLIDQID
jgi:hypothetical protein